MSLPFIQPAVKAVKNWASFGVNEGQEPANPLTRKKRLSFDEQYPRIKTNPIRLNDHQRSDLLPRLGFTSVSTAEVDLALSRIRSDTDPTKVAVTVSAIIFHWREEHPADSDAAAARKLLEGSSSLAAIDSKLESARLAAEQAEKEHQAFEQAYHNFRSIPARVEQLTNQGRKS